jgi:hypothetical protein
VKPRKRARKNARKGLQQSTLSLADERREERKTLGDPALRREAEYRRDPVELLVESNMGRMQQAHPDSIRTNAAICKPSLRKRRMRIEIAKWDNSGNRIIVGRCTVRLALPQQDLHATPTKR